MKVLFAIGNAQTSKSVADKFYQTYGELLEYKDVFYFRALLEEVKKDKSYNVIVISEDVEPMKAITIEEIDDAIFRNIDNLTDEVQDASIVFIGSDRRNKTDSLVNRLYSIGIYSMLLGNDRNITSLCDVIKEPRTKKEAKDYLNLNPSASGTTNSQVLKEDEIKEDELAHILKHYEKLGNDTSKYIPAFESIEEQFTKKQLMTIAAAISVYLPSIVADTISQDPRYEQMFRAVSTKKGAKQNKNNAVQQPKNPAKKSGILNFLSGKRDKKDKMASASQQIIDESARLQEQEEEKARLAAKQAEEEAKKLREESERQAKLEIERIKHETEQRMAKEAAEVAKKKEEERKAQEAAAKYAHEQEILKQRTLNVQKNRVEAERGTNFEKLMNIASGADDINIDISGLEDKKLKVEANKQAEMQEQEMLRQKAMAEQKAREEAAKEAQAKEQEMLKQKAIAEQKAREEAAKETQAKEQEMLKQKAKEEAAKQALASLALKTKSVDATSKNNDIEIDISALENKKEKDNNKNNAMQALEMLSNKVKENVQVGIAQKTIDETEKQAQEQEALKQKALAEQKAREEATRQAQEQEALKQKALAEQKAREEAARQAQEQEELRQKALAEQKAREEAARQAQEQEELRQKALAEQKAREEAARQAQEQEALRQKALAEQKSVENQVAREEAAKQVQELFNASNEVNAPVIPSSNDTFNTTVISPVPTSALISQNADDEPLENNFNTATFQLPSDYKKVIAIVGTNKVGTTFVANAIANNASEKGIKTALLDMTRTRGLYYLYNKSDPKKIQIATECMKNLNDGKSVPIPVDKNKNLFVYTSLPGVSENRKTFRHKTAIDAAKKSCNLLIIDCDFTTPLEYFEQAAEIYIVQDMDLIKLQETTAFLREFKNRNIEWSKLNVIINKYVKSSFTPKKIVEVGLAYYNDPQMTYTEEFEVIKSYITVPFTIEDYVRYTEDIAKDKIVYKNYSEELRNAIEQICKKIYPANNVSSKKKGLFR